MKRVIAKILIVIMAASVIMVPLDHSEAYTGYVKKADWLQAIRK